MENLKVGLVGTAGEARRPCQPGPVCLGYYPRPQIWNKLDNTVQVHHKIQSEI